MVKPLSFKGDKKSKKRKHKEESSIPQGDDSLPTNHDTNSEVEETWTIADSPSDLSGPIMILLPEAQDASSDDEPAPRPTCLASDSTGAVFASPVENIIPETPARLSAEPSDVRQVWVATKVPGEGSGWTLKSHQGKYLSADRFGVLRCEREAAGMEEVFWFTEAIKEEEEDSKDQSDQKERIESGFCVYNSRKTYISASTSVLRNSRLTEIRADAAAPVSSCVVYVRMQSRFKPQLKANRELKEKEKVSRKQLEEAVGRRLNEDEVRKLKKARREGGWHEAVLDARVKGRHDKFA